jgi:hypothetical protein
MTKEDALWLELKQSLQTNTCQEGCPPALNAVTCNVNDNLDIVKWWYMAFELF